ncbi:hypothetical protein RCC89_20650 [Cytophagaceae bacterium ABcell3]|nr:hypothetical protein RCC89_20650 [Cytophagaceae bacterium ABcell3]
MKPLLIIYVLIMILCLENVEAQPRYSNKQVMRESLVQVKCHKYYNSLLGVPVKGVKTKSWHIFMPQYNTYYDTQRGVYIYLNNNRWITEMSVPVHLRNVDLRYVHQIEMELDVNDFLHEL